MEKEKNKLKTVKAYVIVRISSGDIYDVCPRKPKFKGDEQYKVVEAKLTYKL